MPFTGAGDRILLPMSAPYITHNAANTSLSDSTAFATPGAATWPPSAASSAVTSHMDSSAAIPTSITEINLVSSPPTSHAASPSRTRSSPLRPSLAANVVEGPSGICEAGKAATMLPGAVEQTEAFVANSDPEDDEERGARSDGARTPERRSSASSPVRSSRKSASAQLDDDPSSTVYVQIPATSPSSRPPRQTPGSSKKPKKQPTDNSRRRGSDASVSAEAADTAAVDDDAAYAAALAAQEETLARRRPARSRKEVSYGPKCDLDGRPLPSKKQKDSTTSSSSAASASKSKAASKDTATAQKTKSKRRSRAFSDDEEEKEEDAGDDIRGGPSSSGRSKNVASLDDVEGDDGDLTDDDVGFKARDRKKPRVSKQITVISDGDEEEEVGRSTRRKTAKASRDKAKKRADEDADDADSDHGEDILTPPAPTSPRRSSRKSVPSPKKKQLEGAAEDKASKKGKGKSKAQQPKTFDLGQRQEGEDEEEEDEEEAQEADAKEVADDVEEQSKLKTHEEEVVEKIPSSAVPSISSTTTKSAPSASPRPSNSTASRSTPTTVAIKQISTIGRTGTGSASPTLHASSPSTARSFFGKPLSTLLSTGAARRPGLTRKHNIPSLLNHRGAPKPPAPKLAVSKRRMQDDDYEYDAVYEALIAKGRKGSDEEDEEDVEEAKDGMEEEEEDGRREMEEYD